MITLHAHSHPAPPPLFPAVTGVRVSYTFFSSKTSTVPAVASILQKRFRLGILLAISGVNDSCRIGADPDFRKKVVIFVHNSLI